MSYQVARVAPIKLEPYIDPQSARTFAVQMLPNLTIARGTLLGQNSTNLKYGAYASGNNDGTQIPQGLAAYDFVTDANGNVIVGAAGSTLDLTRGQSQTALMYHKGTFLESDLVGLDANAVAALKAMELGSGAQKMLRLG